MGNTTYLENTDKYIIKETSNMLMQDLIKKELGFLTEKYAMQYAFQEFEEYSMDVETYSFYNENGCFTVYYLEQRDELGLFYSGTFSKNLNELREQEIDQHSCEGNIWKKHKPLFGYGKKMYFKTLHKVIEAQIDKTGLFYGVKVD